MTPRGEKGGGLSDPHSFPGLTPLHGLLAPPPFAFLKDAEVESGTSTRSQQRRHSRLIQTNAHAIAGDARLCDLEERASDPVPIADAHRIIRQSFDGEIFAEFSAG